jgi:hypothetical protein
MYTLIFTSLICFQVVSVRTHRAIASTDRNLSATIMPFVKVCSIGRIVERVVDFQTHKSSLNSYATKELEFHKLCEVGVRSMCTTYFSMKIT